MNAVLCVGHSRFINGRRDGGAVSVGGVSEWEYNSELAGLVAKDLRKRGHSVAIIDNYGERSYGQAMRFVSERIGELCGNVAVEMHFNAAHGNARGHEWLFKKLANRSMILAASFEREFLIDLPEMKSRHVKPLTKGERGFTFCDSTPCPAIVAEPFFGSNAQDWKIAIDKKRVIAKAYAQALSQWWAEDQKDL